MPTNKNMSAVIITLFVISWVSSQSATAITLTFQEGVNSYIGTMDTNIREDLPNTSFGNEDLVFIDKVSPPSHGLIRFENVFGNGAGQIPLGVEIIEATLTVNVNNQGGASVIHRMLVSWNETDTWNDWGDNIAPHNNQGGIQTDDSEAVISAEDPGFLPGFLGDLDIDVTASVQAWSDGAANHGWVLLADGWSFRSSEYLDDVSLRPELSVDYVPLPSAFWSVIPLPLLFVVKVMSRMMRRETS